MIVFQTPYSGYNNANSTVNAGAKDIRIPATPTAIEILTNLPQTHPRKSLQQIKVTVETPLQVKAVELDDLDSIDDDEAPEITDDTYDLVKTVSEKRIANFYYLLVAYYDAKCSPSRAKPKLSPGKLKDPQNCAHVYPSLYPRIKDDYFKSIHYHARHQTVDERMQRIMEALRAKLTDAAIAGTSPAGAKLMDTVGTMKSLLSRDCALYHTLHETIEVPHIVAEYNELIEKAVEVLCADLLEGCDQGKIKPYSGCATFVKRLSELLESSYAETKEKISDVQRCQELYNVICDTESKVLKDDPIDTLGYLKATFELLQLMQTISTKNNSLTALVELGNALRDRQKFFLWMIGVLRKDIDYGLKIENPTDFEKFYKRASRRVEGYQEQDGELINIPKRTMSIDEQKDRLLNCDIIDYCLSDGKRRNEFPGLMADQLRLMSSLPKVNFEAEITSLVHSLEINRWMQESNVMPDKEILSGVYEGNKMRPMTKEELFSQKLSLIARKKDDATVL